MKKNFFISPKVIAAFFMVITMSMSNLIFAQNASKKSMPRATPESQGVSSKLILNTIKALENDEIHSLMIARNGNIIFEGFWNPYNANAPHVIHSLTKIFTNTAVGIAFTQGAFNKFGGLNSKVVDVLADFKDENAKGIKEIHRTAFGEGAEQEAAFEKSWRRLQNIRMIDLLHMRSGTISIGGNQWRPLKTSWLANWFAQPMIADPGTTYLYSSANSYVLSAMAQKVMGKDTYNILMDNGFTDMGMEFTWSGSPENIRSGGNGIKATTENLLKIGQLYLNKGTWDGKRILSEEWCDLSLGITILASADVLGKFPSDDAFHWTASAPQGKPNNGTYMAEGVFGQIILVDPASQTVIVTTSGTEGPAFVQSKIVPNFNIPLRAAKEPVEENKEEIDQLNATTKALSRWPTDKNHNSTEVAKLQANINGKAYAVEDPAVTTGKISELDKELMKVPAFQVSFTKDSVNFTLVDNRGTHTITSGFNAPIVGKSSMTGNYMHHQYQTENETVVSLATWLNEDTLRLIWRFPDMAFVDTLTIKFYDNGNKATVDREVSQTSEVKSMTFSGALTGKPMTKTKK